MKYLVRNVSQARRGVEKADGGYVWLEPGDEKMIDVASPSGVERDGALEVEPRADLKPPPASLAAKVAPKPASEARKSAPARATRRRRKAPAR